MVHVLLIEDDPGIRTAVTRALLARGHAVDSAPDGLTGLQMLLTQDPETVILDLGLPDISGDRLLSMIRAASGVPVIVATARDDEGLIVQLLDAGADDYVVKPYDPAHLEARIRAVLRRGGPTTDDDAARSALKVGGLTIDPARRTADIDGRALDLTRLEFDVLAYLAANPGRVVSRKELLREVWQRTDSARTVDVHLSWLRRKLGDDVDDPRFLHVHRGVGIMLEDAAAGSA
ncbi:MAG: response regulator transcription factor [Candidatus Nanopelagicales bacterium]|jgi:DNA-binding response OmpR family regulator|nr:response regulator transcription factor [Candidatus Nanopelagicales bacterium]MCU0297783.1 response regulator transcription factor [Candidatus Nanopelagicales bacterium]